MDRSLVSSWPRLAPTEAFLRGYQSENGLDPTCRGRFRIGLGPVGRLIRRIEGLSVPFVPADLVPSGADLCPTVLISAVRSLLAARRDHSLVWLAPWSSR